jgi:hypothetical protein
MPEAQLLATGESTPDTLRAWTYDRNRRDVCDKAPTASDAVGRPISDGCGISGDSSSITRRPPRRDRNLRQYATFPWMEASTLGDVNDVITAVSVRPSGAGPADRLSGPSTRGTAIPRNHLDPAHPFIGRIAKS